MLVWLFASSKSSAIRSLTLTQCTSFVAPPHIGCYVTTSPCHTLAGSAWEQERTALPCAQSGFFSHRTKALETAEIDASLRHSIIEENPKRREPMKNLVLLLAGAMGQATVRSAAS